MTTETSTNERAEQLMGRRPEGVPVDQPCELGYWCPVCRVPARVADEFDERMHWSEYNGFLWCEVCDRDYPSALCVRVDGEHDPHPDWVKAGPDDAVKVYLDTVEQAVERDRAALRSLPCTPAAMEELTPTLATTDFSTWPMVDGLLVPPREVSE